MQIDRGMMLNRYTLIMLYIIVGLITTLMISLGCAFPQRNIYIQGNQISYSEIDRIIQTHTSHTYMDLDEDLELIGYSSGYIGLHSTSIICYPVMSFPPSSDTGISIEITSRKSGWPMYTLSGEYVNVDDQEEFRFAWLRGRKSIDYDTYWFLPVRPMWPGLVVNTLLFATCWFMVTLGPHKLRKAIRKQRGHCPQCGYDLRANTDSGCPECGWGRNAD